MLDKINRILKRARQKSYDPPHHTSQKVISIKDCRHYCGFRYGSEAFNPYENYIIGLSRGEDVRNLRDGFIDFIRFYRPRNFGNVFNLRLSDSIPFWVFPWSNVRRFDSRRGWTDNINAVPDILTHFCSQGVELSRIEEEFFWLERAFNSIGTVGYAPEQYGYINALELRSAEGSVYIITDGNHRISALAAFCFDEVKIAFSEQDVVKRDECECWFQVQRGLYSTEEALAVFDSYVKGIDGFLRSSVPASILPDKSLRPQKA